VVMVNELEKVMMVEFSNVDDDVIENRLLVMENDDDGVIENLSFDADHLLVVVVKDFFEEYLMHHFLYV
jgi:hypothetical protein